MTILTPELVEKAADGGLTFIYAAEVAAKLIEIARAINSPTPNRTDEHG